MLWFTFAIPMLATTSKKTRERLLRLRETWSRCRHKSYTLSVCLIPSFINQEIYITGPVWTTSTRFIYNIQCKQLACPYSKWQPRVLKHAVRRVLEQGFRKTLDLKLSNSWQPICVHLYDTLPGSPASVDAARRFRHGCRIPSAMYESALTDGYGLWILTGRIWGAAGMKFQICYNFDLGFASSHKYIDISTTWLWALL